jgi:hypothetical protein
LIHWRAIGFIPRHGFVFSKERPQGAMLRFILGSSHDLVLFSSKERPQGARLRFTNLRKLPPYQLHCREPFSETGLL